MPKINPARPAAVYAPALPGAQDAFLPLLTARRLYVLDTRTETLADLAKPVMDRPVLRLHLLHAAMGPGQGAAVFVTDSLATISGDQVERVSVVGALLETGCEVVVGDEDLDMSWYTARAAGAGMGAVADLVEGLLAFRDNISRLWSNWSTGPADGALTALPTSLDLTYEAARLRVKALAEEGDGMPARRIADMVLAEGHLNAEGRHVWYGQAVRDALKAGL